ncbi:hypothetical protein [Halogeometricum limi]|uniref:Uncharacterized protein n=1 Tax=Halogeometricum limi TaxID=555875 RepID=A0A1I6GYL9_9EURY|nr:hypothetical protein [Halogeometricum limi]SFR47260.1 hypothetical protein SAMN04488124_1707 [Halogeometricum limi]
MRDVSVGWAEGGGGTLQSAARSRGRRHWENATRSQRIGYGVGAVLVTSGLVHLGIHLASGTPWAGAVSWRKPTTFGLSFGATLLTVTFLRTFLSRVPRLVDATLVALAVACAGEVAGATLQRWRGVPSHFNEATPFDATVWTAMGALIGVVGLCILVFTIVSLVGTEGSSSLRLAVRLAFFALLAGQVTGAAIVQNADTMSPDERFERAAVVEPAGDLKLVHAATLHAAQLFPAFALVAATVDWSERRRFRTLVVVGVGYAVVCGVLAAQAGGGLAVTDLGTESAVVLLAGVVLVGASVLSLAGAVAGGQRRSANRQRE